MYATSTVLKKIALFEARYKWRPEYHTLAQVEEMIAYMKSLLITNDKGTFFDDSMWTSKLVRFVQNERALCMLDCEYFLTRYYRISVKNNIVPFSLRAGQRIFYKVCQELEEKGVSIEIQVLKARQLGISTLIEGMMTHRALFVPGSKCTIGSADEQKTYVMMGMMYTALENIPWWLSPTQTKDKRSGKGMLEFAHVGASIVVQSGSMKGGIGQGTTPTAVHLSECSMYTDPVGQIEEGLFKAVHPSPEIFMVLESTGDGNSGWWADLWRNNKEHFYTGRARLLPLFIPWYTTPELYPSSDWVFKYPIPKDWKPAPETIQMVMKAELYVRSTEILSKILGSGWKMSQEQKWFWEFGFQEARRKKTEKIWARHMPNDDYEALTGDNDTVFDPETILAIYESRKKNVEVYGILGEGIAEKHDPPPSEVVRDGNTLIAHWKTPKEEELEWIFLEMDSSRTEAKEFDPMKKLLVYEHPEKGADYSIGVDTGTGVGGDRSIISVSKNGYDAFQDVQVAEFSSDDITNTEIYAHVAAIAAYYGQFMDEGRTPKISIEQKRKYGDTCQHQLMLMGMRRHHEFIMYDKKTLRPKAKEGGRLGWWTNEWSRPMLLGMFKYAVENGWYQVNSRFLLAEIEGFEQRSTTSGKTRMDHASGKHDDRIFAAAMAYFTCHDLDVMVERAKIRFNAPKEKEYKIDYSAYRCMIPASDSEREFFGL